jgi:hypothetical protein
MQAGGIEEEKRNTRQYSNGIRRRIERKEKKRQNLSKATRVCQKSNKGEMKI